MKALHYRAFGPPKVAHVRQRQAEESLRPFHGYLTQAVHTARERQVLFQLPWERVKEDLVQIFFTPLETRLVVLRPPARWLLRDWPVEVVPQNDQQLFVVNRNASLSVEHFEVRDDGVAISPAQPLEPGDRVFWCEQDTLRL